MYIYIVYIYARTFYMYNIMHDMYMYILYMHIYRTGGKNIYRKSSVSPSLPAFSFNLLSLSQPPPPLSLSLPPSLPPPSLSLCLPPSLPRHPQPAGHGVAMLLVPSPLHGQENRVFLWSRSNVASPVSILQGHRGAVMEAQWRKVPSGMYNVHVHVHVHHVT